MLKIPGKNTKFLMTIKTLLRELSLDCIISSKVAKRNLLLNRL